MASAKRETQRPLAINAARSQAPERLVPAVAAATAEVGGVRAAPVEAVKFYFLLSGAVNRL